MMDTLLCHMLRHKDLHPVSISRQLMGLCKLGIDGQRAT